MLGIGILVFILYVNGGIESNNITDANEKIHDYLRVAGLNYPSTRPNMWSFGRGILL